jgi:hypothetical protein
MIHFQRHVTFLHQMNLLQETIILNQINLVIEIHRIMFCIVVPSVRTLICNDPNEKALEGSGLHEKCTGW